MCGKKKGSIDKASDWQVVRDHVLIGSYGECYIHYVYKLLDVLPSSRVKRRYLTCFDNG